MNRKNPRFRYAASLLLLLFAGASSALAQGTAFSYQGRLQDAGANANGSYDFQFTLWDALGGGTQQPQPTPVMVTKSGVAVTNGVFTVQLDFGATAFPGADRWLETSVRQTGGGAFTLLSQRQPISSTPYAIRTLSATTADALSSACVGCVQDSQINSVAGSKVNGAIPVVSVPSGSANYIQNTTSPQGGSNFNISGNGVIGLGLIANGSVAIGTTTPTGRFVVAQSTAGTGSVSIVAGTTTVSGTNTQFTTFFHVGDSIAVAGTAARTITAISSDTSLTTSSSFSTTAGGLSYTLFNGTSLAVSVDGKVGIGTASPSYKFHVLQQNDSTAAGNFQSNSPTGFSNGLLVTAGTNANDVSFWSRDQAGNTILMARGDGVVGIGTSNPGMTVEIGTSNPGMKLDINGAVRTQGGLLGFNLSPTGSFGTWGQVGAGSLNFGPDYVGKAGVWGTSQSSVGVYGTSDSNVGVAGVSENSRGIYGRSITDYAGYFDGPVFISGNIVNPSDIRLKKGVSNLGYGLREVLRLRPVTWRWKDRPDRGVQLGLIAQEVETVLPELVATDKDAEQTKGLNYIGLVPVTIKAIQEQQAQIEQQQELIKQQEAEFKKQRAILASQKQQIEALKKLVCRTHSRAAVCR